MRRRQVLALGGTALLAGCLGTDDPDDRPTDDPGSPGADGSDGADGDGQQPTLAADVATAFGAIPETVDGRSLNLFWVLTPERSEEVPNAGQVTDTVGLSPEAVDRAVAALDTGDASRSLLVVVGSFDAVVVAVPDERAARYAVHAADGVAVLGAANDSPWTAGVEDAVAAADDPGAGIAERVAPVVAPLQGNGFVSVSTAPGESDTIPSETVEAVAVARERVGDRRRRREYAIQFASAEAATTAATAEIIAESEGRFSPEGTDVEYEQYGQTVVGSFTTQLPPSQLPDDSPDVRFRVRSEAEGDAVTIAVRGDDTVAPANLEFRVDGEARAPPWGDREHPSRRARRSPPTWSRSAS